MANNVAKDSGKAIALFTQAAEKGNPQARLSLGYCYLEGDGVPVDKEKANQLFNLAAQQGLPAAKKALQQP